LVENGIGLPAYRHKGRSNHIEGEVSKKGTQVRHNLPLFHKLAQKNFIQKIDITELSWLGFHLVIEMGAVRMLN